MYTNDHTLECKTCKKVYTLALNPRDVAAYEQSNALIQSIFTYLTPGERELIISRTCETCFDQMFA
jgi:hypothetical protein